MELEIFSLKKEFLKSNRTITSGWEKLATKLVGWVDRRRYDFLFIWFQLDVYCGISPFELLEKYRRTPLVVNEAEKTYQRSKSN